MKEFKTRGFWTDDTGTYEAAFFETQTFDINPDDRQI